MAKRFSRRLRKRQSRVRRRNNKTRARGGGDQPSSDIASIQSAISEINRRLDIMTTFFTKDQQHDLELMMQSHDEAKLISELQKKAFKYGPVHNKAYTELQEARKRAALTAQADAFTKKAEEEQARRRAERNKMVGKTDEEKSEIRKQDLQRAAQQVKDSRGPAPAPPVSVGGKRKKRTRRKNNKDFPE